MTRQDHEGSSFVRHTECSECGSSDACAVYTDGHTHCFACGRTSQANASPTTKPRTKVAGPLITNLEISALPTRKITEDTCKKFGYGIADLDGKRIQVAPYFDADGNMVAQKLRGPSKSFSVRGELKKVLPFGAQAWPKTGKMITVTEGEIDALSMSQVQGNKWPVVSVPGGAQSAKAHIASNLDYYRGFEEVILMFDSDEPGRKAAQECAEVLGRRAKVAELPLKDANEMLVAGRSEDLINSMWKAKPYRPEGIVDMASLRDRVKELPAAGLSWWSPTLTKLTYGIRTGEIYAFGAGTGVGKTDFFTQQMVTMALEHKVPIGVFSLEQGVTETAKRIAGKVAGKCFHIPDAGWTEADLDGAWGQLTAGGRIFLYDSFGANEWSSIREKMEFLHHTEGVRYFFLDHLTALAAGAEDDERVALEKIMADMGALVKRLDCTIFLISHLATPEGKPHEEGGRVTIRHFKGSRAIGFWSHFMLGLERDQQADDEATRTTTTVRLLKDRYTGRATGSTFFLGYDRDTGRLYETVDPEQQQSAGFKDESSPETSATADF